MTAIGQIERTTQRRVVALFQKQLGYPYLGDRTDRAGRPANARRSALSGGGVCPVLPAGAVP